MVFRQTEHVVLGPKVICHSLCIFGFVPLVAIEADGECFEWLETSGVGIATMALESSPPLRKTPKGTSLTNRSRTHSFSIASSRSRHSDSVTDSSGSNRSSQYGSMRIFPLLDDGPVTGGQSLNIAINRLGLVDIAKLEVLPRVDNWDAIVRGDR